MKKILSIFLIITVLTQILSYSVFASSSDMIFDGVNYLQTGNQPVTYKGNIWRSGTQESNVMLPFREQWNTDIGTTSSQPLANGKYVYVLADNMLKQINSVTHKVTGTITIQTKPSPSKTHLTLVKNSDGWFNSDKIDRLLFGSEEGYVYCVKLYDDSMTDSWVDWKYKASSYAISTNPMFSFDAFTNEPYVIFGDSSKLYVLSSKGAKVTEVTENGKITTPVIYHSNNSQIYSVFLYGVDTSSKGYISSGFINNGIYQENPMLNKNISDKYGIKGIAGITTEVVDVNGVRESVIFVVDKTGAAFCISLRTGDLLWRLTKYSTSSSTTCAPVIDDEYIYITISNFNNTNKAKLIAVDYRNAINSGYDDASGSVAFETNSSEFSGTTSISPNIIRVAKTNEQGNTDIRGKIAIVADKGAKDNLRIFYTNEKVDSGPKRVKDAFQTYNSSTKAYETTDIVTVPQGVQAEMLYAFNTLYIIDGNGIIHAYAGKIENNLALLNMQNSTLTVQAGKEYEITADIANYTGADTKPINIQFNLVTDSGEKYPINKNGVIIPANGSSIHLSYTVPSDYKGKYFSVRCEVNAQDENGMRQVDESSYEDNIQELRIQVSGKIDIKVSKISEASYKEKMFVTTPVEFINYSDYDVQNVPIQIWMDGKQLAAPDVPDTINISKHSTTTISVKWYTGELESNIKHVNLRVIIDNDHKYTDDSITRFAERSLVVTRAIPDFEVVSISPVNYVQNSRVLTNIIVRNNSDDDYVGDKKVKFTFSINNSVVSQEVELKHNSEIQITKTWNSPAAGTKVTLRAEINPAHNPEETDYTNNVKSINAKIVKTNIHKDEYIQDKVVEIIPAPTGCTTTHRSWIETRFDHWETRIVGTRTEEGFSPTNERITVTINIYETFAVYKDYSFYASLSISSSVSESKMKSGYGFECTVTTSMSTNYDNPAAIIGPQMLAAYFPETQYNVPIALEPTDALGSWSNTWHFYVNSRSVLGKKNHYVPVWFPDNKYYNVMFVASYAQSPGGSLCATDKDSSILIDQSMYIDDYSSGGK